MIRIAARIALGYLWDRFIHGHPYAADMARAEVRAVVETWCPMRCDDPPDVCSPAEAQQRIEWAERELAEVMRPKGGTSAPRSAYVAARSMANAARPRSTPPRLRRR